MTLPADLLAKLKRAIALSNPTGLHPLAVARFKEFFAAVYEAGLQPSCEMLDGNWPASSRETMGGDPAKSEYVRKRVRGLLDEWLNR